MHRFTAAVGKVDTSVRTNWVRLATYSFNAADEVWESHWHWSQTKRVVSTPLAGKLAKLTFRGSSFGATHGWAYGSNAAWSARASMAQIDAYDHTKLNHDYYLWKTGNSHVKPMLQIVDEDGAFHGWVGAEASLNQTVPAQGTSADDLGVFRIAEY